MPYGSELPNAIVLLVDSTMREVGAETTSRWFVGRCDLPSNGAPSTLFVGELTTPTAATPRLRLGDKARVRNMVTFACDDPALDAKSRALKEVAFGRRRAFRDAQRAFAEALLAAVKKQMSKLREPEREQAREHTPEHSARVSFVRVHAEA